jgi:hypothetical protein
LFGTSTGNATHPSRSLHIRQDSARCNLGAQPDGPRRRARFLHASYVRRAGCRSVVQRLHTWIPPNRYVITFGPTRISRVVGTQGGGRENGVRNRCCACRLEALGKASAEPSVEAAGMTQLAPQHLRRGTRPRRAQTHAGSTPAGSTRPAGFRHHLTRPPTPLAKADPTLASSGSASHPAARICAKVSRRGGIARPCGHARRTTLQLTAVGPKGGRSFG